MRRIRAIPWISNVECCGRAIPVDMQLEQFGRGMLPKKYERVLSKFFKTNNRKTLLQKALHSDIVPIYCDRCNTVELVNYDTGNMIKKIAHKIVKEIVREE